MQRRSLRCVVDLDLHAVSAPGVWLPSKEDVYVSVSLFNQYRNTRLVSSIFPLVLNDRFHFEKTFYTALDPSHVSDMLEDELVIFEILQLSEYTDGAVRLASFSSNAREFLYPYPALAPSYSSHEREILMCRTVAFPGISPKLEFTSKTVIKESISPELDALEDALSRRKEVEYKTRRRPSSRTRSPSPMRRSLVDVETIDPRPPFVVRKLQDDLIGRKPGNDNEKHALARPKSSTRCSRLGRRKSFSGGEDLSYSYDATKRFDSPLRYSRTTVPAYKSTYSAVEDEIDKEVAKLTRERALKALDVYRPRPISPVLYRPSLRKYVDDLVLDRELLTRELALDRARRLNRLYGTYYTSLDDHDLELRLARLRALRY